MIGCSVRSWLFIRKFSDHPPQNLQMVRPSVRSSQRRQGYFRLLSNAMFSHRSPSFPAFLTETLNVKIEAQVPQHSRQCASVNLSRRHLGPARRRQPGFSYQPHEVHVFSTRLDMRAGKPLLVRLPCDVSSPIDPVAAGAIDWFPPSKLASHCEGFDGAVVGLMMEEVGAGDPPRVHLRDRPAQ